MKARHTTRDRPLEAGISLLELVVSMAVMSIVIMTAGLTLMRGHIQRVDSHEAYLVTSVLRDSISTIQDIANLPQNLAAKEGIGAIYSRYHQQTLVMPELEDGQMDYLCFANEQTVPDVLGGPQDLNFDGDAQDDLGNQSNGTDLKLVPMRMTLTYTQGGTSRSAQVNFLISVTRD